MNVPADTQPSEAATQAWTANALEARKQNLARANEIRIARTRFCRQTYALSHLEGKAAVAQILRRPTEEIGSFRLEELLTRSIRQFGRAGALRVSKRAGLSPNVLRRRVRDLSSQDRLRVAWVLEGKTPPRVTRAEAVGL